MHLLNILACSVHGNDKSSVGSLAIPVKLLKKYPFKMKRKFYFSKYHQGNHELNSNKDEI
jgi:hypothetical protein